MGRIVTSLIICGLAFMLAGCAQQVSVSNQTNNFNYAGQAAGKDETETYTWKNTIGNARVSWGGQVGKGSITVTVEDAGGRQMFSRSLSGQSQDGFDGSTGMGEAGDWKIRLTFKDYTGQMGLSIRAGASGVGGDYGGSWGT